MKINLFSIVDIKVFLMESPYRGPHPATQCPTCLFLFGSPKACKQHECLVKLCLVDEEADLVVRDPEDIGRVKEATRFNSPRQVFQVCESTRTVLPGTFPLFFPPKGKNTFPVLEYTGCTSGSYEKLKLAASEGPVSLKRQYKVRLSGNILVFDESFLIPNNLSLLIGFEV